MCFCKLSVMLGLHPSNKSDLILFSPLSQWGQSLCLPDTGYKSYYNPFDHSTRIIDELSKHITRAFLSFRMTTCPNNRDSIIIILIPKPPGCRSQPVKDCQTQENSRHSYLTKCSKITFLNNYVSAWSFRRAWPIEVSEIWCWVISVSLADLWK